MLSPPWVPNLPGVPSTAARVFCLLLKQTWRCGLLLVHDTGLVLYRGLQTPLSLQHPYFLSWDAG